MAVDLVAFTYRLLHIVFGVAWIGAIAFSVAVLRVVTPRLGQGSRKEFLLTLIPVVIRYIPLVAVLTILFGSLLYVHLGAYDVNVLFYSAWGQTLLAALILAIGTLAYGIVGVIGAARKLLVHLKEEVCEHGPVVRALTVRFNMGQILILGLGVVILGIMVYVVGVL